MKDYLSLGVDIIDTLQKTKNHNGSRSPISQVPQLLPVKRYKIRSHYDGVFSLSFTKDGSRLAVGYGSGDVTLHDTRTAKLTCCPSRKSDPLPVTGLQFRTEDRSEMLYCLASGPIFLQRVGGGIVGFTSSRSFVTL